MDNLTTTFIIVRHAERESTETDSNLSGDGLLRAEALLHTLSNVAVNAIYSTPFNRTRQTVKSLANEKGIIITEYSNQKQYEDLVNEILAENRGKVVVIVGHCFTIPDIVKTLSKNSFSPTISEDQYDDLFIISHSNKLSPTILQLKYGRIYR